MAKNKKIRIHIADDHLVLIDGLIAVLRSNPDFEVVGTSHNGQAIVEWFKENEADVMIMDINMPIMDGLEVLKYYEPTGLPAEIIVLSSYDDVKLIKEVLKMGVNSFLAKKCAAEHIIESILEVSKGNQFFSPGVQEKIIKSFSGFQHKTNSDWQDGTASSLITDREMEILKLIAQEYTSREISENLFISTNTVETHRKSLMKKLNMKSSLGLAKYALIHKLIDS